MKNNIRVIIVSILMLISLLNARDLEKVSIQLQWLDQFQFAGYYMAKEKGFYTDVGLDVEIKRFKYGINVVDEVMSKKATYGIGRSSLIVNKSNGTDIKLLSAIFQSSPSILLATDDSNIKTIKDFFNKRIMSTPDVYSSVSFQAILKQEGVNINDMITQEHSFNIDDLINKKTDLMASYISNEPFLLKEKGVKYKIFDPKDYGFDFYSDILFTSNYELINYKQRVIKFKTASLKGWEYAFNHIDETVQIILKKYNIQNKSKEALLYEANELKKLAYYKVNHLGHIDKHKIQRIYDIYNVMGYIKNKVVLDEFIFQYDKKTNISLTHLEQEYLKNKQEIKMCIDPKWMPFEAFDEDGKHIGISADYFKLFQKNLQIPIKIVKTTSWSQSLEYAKERKCDILSLVMQTPKRKKYMNFTTPYLKTPLVLATKPEVPFIVDFNILTDEKIGIVKDYAYLEIFKKKYQNLNIIEVDSVEDGLEKVRDGKLFGYIGTLASVGYLFQKEFTGELQIAAKLDETWKLGIAVRNDDKILFGILQKAVDNLDIKEQQKIFNDWVSIKYKKSIDYILIWKIIGVFIIILLIILYFLIKQNMLKNKIENLNQTLEERINTEVEKNRLQDQQMLNQSRLAQMGEMISMIAHQWRQPLNAISVTSNNLQLKCIMGEIDKEFFKKELGLIDDYSQYLSSTIDDFRNFFKDNKEKEITNLKKLVEGTLSLVTKSVENKNIKIITSFSCTHNIETFPNEVIQVILNIIKNAEDILFENNIENPTITIDTVCGVEHSKPSIIIKDNGGGIPDDIIQKIFNPYFSTKLEKDGTGLGLYMSKTIIEEHCGGKLSVTNDENGAVFIIDFWI
ncbi:MAG: ABC transporter substrate-binding protein [Sulfurimonas sp.]|nr:ABC transporter substrate-binding protein [Sulfurimonas sp.]